MTLAQVAFWLIVGHAVCDYPLQGDFLAKAKNHKAPIPGVDWAIALAAHAAIHAGAVMLATGSLVLACAEYAAHVAIDWGKCQGFYGFRYDQGLHMLCKALWLVLLTKGIC